MYETLMTEEESVRAEDLDEYYRIADDNRNLNYDKYLIKGRRDIEKGQAFTSENARHLTLEEAEEKIRNTKYVRNTLADFRPRREMDS